MSAARIAVLTPALADQIAAGEVVERPASVVKELVENAIDAGATRVDVRLHSGGREGMRVVDNGSGLHPEDLALALRRHATSKVHTSRDLVEIGTLGFRGEALASIAAVARLSISSRTPGHESGHRITAVPGAPARLEATAMAPGTHVEVGPLFAGLPARRKFMRAEATEAAHCVETLVRLALVEPRVHLLLHNGVRTLLDLPPAEERARWQAVLARRGGGEPWWFEQMVDGVAIRGVLLDPRVAATRGNGYILVRRRVVQSRVLAQIVRNAFEDLASGPLAYCIAVEPPTGTVDVNVHPQKSEVRFSEEQGVYSALRSALAALRGERKPPPDHCDADPSIGVEPTRGPSEAAAAPSAWVSAAAQRAAVAREGLGGERYRLGTAAASPGYVDRKAEAQRAAEALGRAQRIKGVGDRSSAEAAFRDSDLDPGEGPVAAAPLEFAGYLPGPRALFRDTDALWVLDLRRVRTHLLRRQLLADLHGAGVCAQRLIAPVTVELEPDAFALVASSVERLAQIGLEVSTEGSAIVVRAVPARLRDCVDAGSVEPLLRRLLPWLRVAESESEPEPAVTGATSEEAVELMAATEVPAPPPPRLARAWFTELRALDEDLESVPGVVRWSAEALCPS